MKLVPQSAPYIRKPVSVSRMMTDVIIALLPVTVFAMVQNGWASIYVLLISLAAMIGSELIANMLIKWPKGMKAKELFTKDGFAKVKATYTVNNFLAPIISALIYALILPAGCAPYVVLVGALFGMIIGKMVFGGLGKNIFNPAAVGRIFVAICFGAQLNEAYPTQDPFIKHFGVDAAAGATPLGFTKGNLGNIGNFNLLDLFIGNIPGSMGEVSAICILAGAIYLFARRSADLRAALSYILSFAVVMFVACISFAGKNNQMDKLFNMWLYQILAGGMLFAGVFMITDPVTSPITKFGRVAYGATAGVITVFIRIMGAYPEGAAFSILIANMFAPCIDYFMRGKPNTYTWKQCLGLGVVIICAACIASASVMGGWF